MVVWEHDPPARISVASSRTASQEFGRLAENLMVTFHVFSIVVVANPSDAEMRPVPGYALRLVNW